VIVTLPLTDWVDAVVESDAIFPDVMMVDGAMVFAGSSVLFGAVTSSVAQPSKATQANAPTQRRIVPHWSFYFFQTEAFFAHVLSGYCLFRA
jgi:quinol-cytochrome oxidoreductase complex cytochrome b subunit